MKRILIISILLILNSLPLFSKSRIPKNAKWDPKLKGWYLRNKDGDAIAVWDKQKRLFYREFYNKMQKKSQIVYFFKDKTKNIWITGQYFFDDRLGENQPGEPLPHIGWTRYGNWKDYYKSGQLKRSRCLSYDHFERDKYNAVVPGEIVSCGKEVQYNLDGSVKKVIQHKHKCIFGCGEFTPFLKKGEYLTTAKLKLRSYPSLKSKTLYILQKKVKVQLVRDTQRFMDFAGNTAPWVLIKTKNGKTGYVFGAYLQRVAPLTAKDYSEYLRKKFGNN